MNLCEITITQNTPRGTKYTKQNLLNKELIINNIKPFLKAFVLKIIFHKTLNALIPYIYIKKKMKSTWHLVLFYTLISFACSNVDNDVIDEPLNEETPMEIDEPVVGTKSKNIKILALGDSYTIGQSVCETCRFPEQLKDNLKLKFDATYSFDLEIIAQTGWTTSNLKSAINAQDPAANKDLVTLLIGVNNQYQNNPFSLYEQEFPELVQTAKRLAKGNINNVIVVSIPDYAYTTFGGGNKSITDAIDKYNAFAKNYCLQNGIDFVNITDITRMGLQDTDLVASDGLHPSKLAYSKFVERILPIAVQKLKD